nr:T9SS type A sorting domain-containing protein [Chitinophagaceae bacterium]
TYSSVVKIALQKQMITRSVVFPNPTRSHITLAVGSSELIDTKAALIDNRGRVVQQVIIASPNQVLNLDKLSPGMYYLKLKNGEVMKILKQ